MHSLILDSVLRYGTVQWSSMLHQAILPILAQNTHILLLDKYQMTSLVATSMLR
jgi:hypothetical protein